MLKLELEQENGLSTDSYSDAPEIEKLQKELDSIEAQSITIILAPPSSLTFSKNLQDLHECILNFLVVKEAFIEEMRQNALFIKGNRLNKYSEDCWYVIEYIKIMYDIHVAFYDLIKNNENPIVIEYSDLIGHNKIHTDPTHGLDDEFESCFPKTLKKFNKKFADYENSQENDDKKFDSIKSTKIELDRWQAKELDLNVKILLAHQSGLLNGTFHTLPLEKQYTILALLFGRNKANIKNALTALYGKANTDKNPQNLPTIVEKTNNIITENNLGISLVKNRQDK